MSDQVRSIHRRGKLTREQIERDEEVRRLVMREFRPVQYVVAWFDRQYGQMKGFEALRGFRWEKLRELLDLSAQDRFEGPYPIGPAHVPELSRYLDHQIDLEKYLYRLRSQVSEMLPLEELPPIQLPRAEQGDAA